MTHSIRTMNATADNKRDFGGRHVFQLSNDHILSIVRDDNTGGNERFYVYETTDRATWTLRATITPDTSPAFRMTAAIGPDNDLHIAMISADQNLIKYCRMDYADYSVGAWQTARDYGAGVTVTDLDIDVTTDGKVYIANTFWRGTGAAYGFGLQRRDSSWAEVDYVNLHSTTWKRGCESISIVAAGTQTLDAVTYTALIIAVGYSQGTKDKGVKIYRPLVKAAGTLKVALDSTGMSGFIGAGTGNPSSTYYEGRLVKLFRDPDTTDWVNLGIMHAEMDRRIIPVRVPVKPSITTNNLLTYMQNPVPSASIGGRYMGMSYGAGNLMFLYSVGSLKFPVKTIQVFGAYKTNVFGGDYLTFIAEDWMIFDKGYVAGETVNLISSAGQGNFNTLGDVVFQTSGRNFRHESLTMDGIPINLGPTGTIDTPHPTVTATPVYGHATQQTTMKVEFQFASDAGFTTSVQSFVSGPGVSIPGNFPVSQVVPDTIDLGIGTVYMRARHADIFGNTGDWSDSVTLFIQHPPSASNLVPAAGTTVLLTNAGKLAASWTFNDASTSDTQSAYQVEIILNSDGSTILDTGKVSSSATSVLLDFPSGNIGDDVSWRVTLWDASDTQGPTTGFLSFVVEVPPTLTVTAPVTSDVLATPVVHAEFSVDTTGGATISSYRVLVTAGSTVAWDSGSVSAGDAASGTAFTVDSPGGVLTNSQNYTVTISAKDSRGFTGTADPIYISTSWVPPDAPTAVVGVDVSQYDVDGAGYVKVTWDDSGKDADWIVYVLQRREDLIDPATGDIISEGIFEDIATIYDNDTTYEYHDYFAPSNNYAVSYRIYQGATVFNDIVYSDPGDLTVGFPKTTSYFLADDVLGAAYQLSNISDDSYTEEYETASYHVIGRGNHVDQGDRLGFNGTLTAKLRTSSGITARHKKQVLEDIRKLRRPLSLRTPFGDVFKVSVGDMQVSRIAGVGAEEFCDVTIPYLEVDGAL